MCGRRRARARATPTRGGRARRSRHGANGQSCGPLCGPIGPARSRTAGNSLREKLPLLLAACRRGGRRFATMTQIESKHDVRRKVREAQAQANRERLKTESDNREDMVAFLVAQQKLTAVDEWESDRHEQVRLEADQRREEQRLEGARACGADASSRGVHGQHCADRRVQRENRAQLTSKNCAPRCRGSAGPTAERFASTGAGRAGSVPACSARRWVTCFASNSETSNGTRQRISTRRDENS